MLEYLKLETWLPPNVSTYGAEIDFLFYIIYYITGVAFLLVAAVMVAFIILYRHREGRRARYVHGNTALEIVWTVGTALIVIVLGILSSRSPAFASVARKSPETVVLQIAAEWPQSSSFPASSCASEPIGSMPVRLCTVAHFSYSPIRIPSPSSTRSTANPILEDKTFAIFSAMYCAP